MKKDKTLVKKQQVQLKKDKKVINKQKSKLKEPAVKDISDSSKTKIIKKTLKKANTKLGRDTRRLSRLKKTVVDDKKNVEENKSKSKVLESKWYLMG